MAPGWRRHYRPFPGRPPGRLQRSVAATIPDAERERLLSEAINQSDIGVIVAGPDRRIIFANAGCLRMFGHTHRDLVGRLPTEILTGPHTDQRVVAHMQGRALAGKGYSVELMTYTRDGRPFWVSAVVNPVHDEAGELLNFVGVLNDITLTKMHEVLQHEVLDAMAHDLPLSELMLQVCRKVERIAPEVTASILGVDEQGGLHTLAAPGLSEAFTGSVEGLQVGPCVGSCGTAIWRNEPVIVTDIATDPLWAAHRDGALAEGMRACWSTPIRAGNGRPLGAFAFYYRESRLPSALHRKLVEVSAHLCALIIEREQSRAHIHRLAFYDGLTGLPNRTMLHSQLEPMLAEAQRSGTPLAVLLVDLDRFKPVNDTMGHTAGDEMLRLLAARMASQAGPGDIVSRLAGDEFVLVLPHCGTQRAAAFAMGLIAMLAQPVEIRGSILHPAASIGIAMFPEDGDTADGLVRHADLAMYQAKTQGLGGFRFFSAEMNQAVQQRAQLEAELRQALINGGLSLHYQPQVDAGGIRVHGVEALLRWEHPLLGSVPPRRFVALAEECGLMGSLSAWVLTHACLQLAEWRRAGLPVPHVSVNLSASNFRDPGLAKIVSASLSHNGLEPADLRLELTENIMLDPDPMTVGTIRALDALGVALSIDDFGTGYSSLSYLHRLPIRELKLDKSFVQDIEHSETARSLTTSVLRIGHSLGMAVVAEGVETEYQRCFLERSLAEVVIQGFLTAPPMSAIALTRWLEDRIRSSMRVP